MAEPLVLENYINGQFSPPSSNEYIDSENPATKIVTIKVPKSNESDGDNAIAAAEAALPAWSALSPEARSVWMNKLADEIERNFEAFAQAESADQGKPVSVARKIDVPRCVKNFRFFAEVIKHSHERMRTMTANDGKSVVNYTHKSPIGVCGLIAPWNLPIYLLSWKIAPCIAFGNTCVAKPAQVTSHTAYLLAKATHAVDFPKGVINILFGDGRHIANYIVQHPKTRAISFTGSTYVGKIISNHCGRMLKKCSMELGGKNPAVIFDDCDLERAAQKTAISTFTNQGEVCLCTEKVYVHRSIYEKFLERLIYYAETMFPVGLPSDPNTKFGALVSKVHYNEVVKFVEDAIQQGAKVEIGWFKNEQVKTMDGYFFPPTILTNCTEDMTIMNEEVFGPLCCVIPFDTEEEVIAAANRLEYGLAATLFTENVGRAHRVGQALMAGTVWVNNWLVRDLHMPFGGMKDSGLGRESALESEEFFTEIKTVSISF